MRHIVLHPDRFEWICFAALIAVVIICLTSIMAQAQCAPDDLVCMTLP